MSGEELVNYGALGAVVAIVMPTFLFWVRAARKDMKEALAQGQRTTDRFLQYVQETASRHAETMLAVSNRLERLDKRVEDGFSDIGRRVDRSAGERTN